MSTAEREPETVLTGEVVGAEVAIATGNLRESIGENGAVQMLGALGLPIQPRGRAAAIVREAFAEGVARRGQPRPADDDSEVPVAAEVQRQQAQARRSALLSCLPPDRMDCLEHGLGCLDKGDQHPDELLAWLNDPSARTLILAGTPGNGKTQAGYATLTHAARYGAAMEDKRKLGVRPLLVRAWEVNTFIGQLRPEGSKEPVWKIRDLAYNAECLLMDDLGAELDTEEMSAHMREELARLVTWRLEHRKRTIFTTNRRAAALKLMVGSRLWSRLNDRSTAIRFVGPDRRAIRELDW